ncbi:MAG TPA: tail fiber domain-containing protein [Verrucomicrobiae bacterium]|nr:tail fiber domain-containing protein [Verrucomicrobiae bacterium]
MRVDSSSVTGTWFILGNTSTGGSYWKLVSTGSGNGEGAGKLLFASSTLPGQVANYPLTLQSNTRVGIGTWDPQERLHVSGGRLLVSGGEIRMDNGYTVAAKNSSGVFENFLWPRWVDNITYLNYGAGGFNIRNNTSASVMFMQNNGNVGIGTTTPSMPLTVRHSSIPGLRLDRPDGRYAEFYRDSVQVVVQLNSSLHSAGNRYALFDGDSNWDFGSDRSLKKDIVDAEPMLDRAMKVQVRRFRWKESEPDSKHMLGVIAQELQPLFPEMVGSYENPETKQKTLTVGYSDLGVVAIKAIQELKQQHDSELSEIKAQLAELARENKELRSRLDTPATTTAAAR